ncbi:hypothetical protein [Paraburkholderia adhaesiva]|uniref:hypothetical protein n=1 Tax=Paraburkholderia adhaesiva TaxID=2883244 RepID=UPI001F438680|nr:hypothetical protein [Paraburkholderia adhaesiva]
MGFDIAAGVDGDNEHSSLNSSQTNHSVKEEDVTAGPPIYGIVAGCFSPQDNVLDRIPDAIDKRMTAPS